MTQPKAVITHPQHSEWEIYVQKPKQVALIELNAAVMGLVAPVAVQDAEGNVIFNERTGEPYVFTMQRPVPMKMRIARLRAYITGTNIPGVSIEDLGELYEEKYDVKLDACAVCNAATHGDDVDHPFSNEVHFGRYLIDRLQEPTLFESDPTVNASASQ